MRLLLYFFVIPLTLNACGIKGGLYIPEQRYPQKNISQVSTDAATQTPQAEAGILKTTPENK